MSGKVSSFLSKFANLAARYANMLSVISVSLIMLVIGGDIAGRFLFNSPLPSTAEIAKSLMVFVVLLALANAEFAGQHIRVEFIAGRLPHRVQDLLDVFTYLLGIGLFVPILWTTWQEAWTSLLIGERIGGSLALPLYPSKFAVPVGSGLLILQFIIKGTKSLRRSLFRSEVTS